MFCIANMLPKTSLTMEDCIPTKHTQSFVHFRIKVFIPALAQTWSKYFCRGDMWLWFLIWASSHMAYFTSRDWNHFAQRVWFTSLTPETSGEAVRQSIGMQADGTESPWCRGEQWKALPYLCSRLKIKTETLILRKIQNYCWNAKSPTASQNPPLCPGKS